MGGNAKEGQRLGTPKGEDPGHLKMNAQNSWWASTLLLAVCTGCSDERTVIARAVSPRGDTAASVTIHTGFPHRPMVEFAILGRGKTVSIEQWRGTQMYPCFAAIAWNASADAVIALFRDCWHGTYIVAFDLRQGRKVDAAAMRPALAERIRTEYELPASVKDPIEWASSVEAKNVFARRYP